ASPSMHLLGSGPYSIGPTRFRRRMRGLGPRYNMSILPIQSAHLTKGSSMGKIFIVVPDAPMEETAQLKSGRTLGSGGIRLGVLDNSKANADHLLNLIVEGVKKEFKVDSVVVKRKPTSSRPATDQMLDELAKEADLVVSAMADCGSCTSWSVHDMAQLTK